MSTAIHRPAARSPVCDGNPLAESVYRTVTALRAIPELAAESLAPDFYLAAADSATAPRAAGRSPKEPRP